MVSVNLQGDLTEKALLALTGLGIIFLLMGYRDAWVLIFCPLLILGIYKLVFFFYANKTKSYPDEAYKDILESAYKSVPDGILRKQLRLMGDKNSGMLGSGIALGTIVGFTQKQLPTKDKKKCKESIFVCEKGSFPPLKKTSIYRVPESMHTELVGDVNILSNALLYRAGYYYPHESEYAFVKANEEEISLQAVQDIFEKLGGIVETAIQFDARQEKLKQLQDNVDRLRELMNTNRGVL